MKNTVGILFIVAALVVLVFAFMAGVYPHHDYVLSTFLIAWALVVAWLGSVIGARLP